MKDRSLFAFGLGLGFGALAAYALRRQKEADPLAKSFATWQAELALTRGEVEAAFFVARVRKRYTDLYTERPRFEHPALRVHLEENILPGLALYQELLADGIEQEAALEVVEQLVMALLRPRRQVMEALGKLPFFYQLTRAMLPGMMKNFPPEGWETEWVEVSDERLAFNMHRCFYLDTFTAYGASELTPIYCSGDDFLYADAWPQVRFERTQTLGRGGELCDFCFRDVSGAADLETVQ